MALAVNTVPPWVHLNQAEDADLPPGPTPVPSRQGHAANAQRHARWAPDTADAAAPASDELDIPRAESPEPLAEGPDPPAPARPPLTHPRSSSSPQPQQSGSSNPIRARLHHLRQRLSEYHVDPDSSSSSSSSVANDDYDPDYEDISDDEIHPRPRPRIDRPRSQGRRRSRHVMTALDRSRSLEQTHNPRDKDEWQAATLLLSPAERRRLGREIRQTLAQSGSYWAKRRQRRRLRQQMRHGRGANDPRDSFQPMNLTIEAAETFGARAFTGHDPPSRVHTHRLVAGVQHPDAPLLPVPAQFAEGGDSRLPHIRPPHQHILHLPHRHSHLTPVASRSSSGDASNLPAATIDRQRQPSSQRPTPDPARAHLARMSGLNTSFHWAGHEDPPLSEKDVITLRRAGDERWNTPWKPQVALESLPQVHNGPTWGLSWHRRPGFGSEVEDDTGFGYGFGSKNKKYTARYASWSWWRGFLLHHPFGPLFVRSINLVITTCTLAVAIRERQSLRRMGVENIVGVSPLLGIIFAPLTLAHIFFQVWLEYFGRPIGLWSVRSKLFGTSIEIVFVGMWSAEMALAWDNYFTTPNDELNPKGRAYIRRLQCFLIGLSFISLFAYMITLIVRLSTAFLPHLAHDWTLRSLNVQR